MGYHSTGIDVGRVMQPSYLHTYQTGELQERTERLVARLKACDICPRVCGVDRTQGHLGFCSSPAEPLVASVCRHRGEEPPISGTRGSGTIFFANCNLRCVFCQNFQISQNPQAYDSQAITPRELAEHMVRLQDELGCHNVNLVSPTHFVPAILQALCIAIPLGLRVPIVYNTGGYDSVDVLQMLDGVVDVYLPDLKYASNVVSRRLSGADDYVQMSRAALTEMHRQVGSHLSWGEDGTVARGMVVRHLVLPGGLAGSEDSLRWLAEALSPDITLSLMAQYYPAHRAVNMPVLSRLLSRREYADVVRFVQETGFTGVWTQETRAQEFYRPDFSREEHPFESDTSGMV